MRSPFPFKDKIRHITGTMQKRKKETSDVPNFIILVIITIVNGPSFG